MLVLAFLFALTAISVSVGLLIYTDGVKTSKTASSPSPSPF